MRFETGAGDLHLGNIFGLGRFVGIGELAFAVHQFEEVRHAEVFQHFRNSRIGVEQLGFAMGGFFFARQLESDAGQHAEKGAVHHHAIGEVKDEMFLTAIGQLFDELVQVDAGDKCRPAADLYTDDAVEDRHTQICTRVIHLVTSKYQAPKIAVKACD